LWFAAAEAARFTLGGHGPLLLIARSVLSMRSCLLAGAAALREGQARINNCKEMTRVKPTRKMKNIIIPLVPSLDLAFSQNRFDKMSSLQYVVYYC